MTVKRILASQGNEVLTIEPTAVLATAAKLLSERRIGALVVTVPTVGSSASFQSATSCARSAPAARSARGAGGGGHDTQGRYLRCQRDTTADLMEQMTAGKFRHLPVVEQGRLVGIVSIGDVRQVTPGRDATRHRGATGFDPNRLISVAEQKPS